MRTAIIIGAGPAGLTAAYELLQRTDIKPVIVEKTRDIGGIAKTVCHNGNRIDVGGHRFFSKSQRVNDWWLSILPLQGSPARDDRVLGRELAWSAARGAPDPELTNEAMLLRLRRSRILHMRKFFDYPVSLNSTTVRNLGLVRMARVGGSYLRAQILPREETNLENFMINRFGNELYTTFFKEYTEKVWGISASQIKPEWGVQRIKGLSAGKVLAHALTRRSAETSLIDEFMYPKLGPGQLWEEVARRVTEMGGEILFNQDAIKIVIAGDAVMSITMRDAETGEERTLQGEYFFSSMPVKDLVSAMGEGCPAEVRAIADSLRYRDFITVGILLRQLSIRNETKILTVNNIIPDTWLYVQEPGVKVGRIQIFNNWSPYLVKDPATVWIGLEYFCNEGDDLWSRSDDELKRFGAEELQKIGIISQEEVLDSVVVRMPKAYPAYFGAYERFPEIRRFTDRIGNLFLIGRNGMHRYNNSDHSMLTAMTAVDNIIAGITSKENIWAINTEEEHHEDHGMGRQQRSA
jgi:protoporphyrinogen oxidase